MSLSLIKYVLFILAFALTSGCKKATTANENGTLEIRDMLDRKVRIPENINRIIGLRAGALRLLTYMSSADRVVGIEEAEKRSKRPYTDAYPYLLNQPVIGPMMGGDAELIIRTDPDLIFMTYTTQSDADALQKKTGIPVIAIICPEFGTQKHKFYSSLRLIGRILHKSDRADSLVNFIEHSIRELNSRTSNIPNKDKKSVYIGGMPYSGLHGINSTHPFYPPFTFIDAKNVASSIDESLVSHVKGTYIDIEKLLVWDPDYLFIDISGFEIVRKELNEKKSLFNDLAAVQNNRIHLMLPYNNYATNYEYVLANAWIAGKILYPERFSDINIRDKADEILDNFFIQREKYNLSYLDAIGTLRF